MPLTPEGRKALKNFKKQYGEKEGEKYFYAYMNKHPERTKKWHKSSKKAKYHKKIKDMG